MLNYAKLITINYTKFNVTILFRIWVIGFKISFLYDLI